MLNTTTQDKLAKLAKVATRIPNETELDRFAAYVVRGATITGARWNVVEAEDNESEMAYKPEGGLTEEHYRRLGNDNLERMELARAVVMNLLRRRGHKLWAIEAAFREIDYEALPELIEDCSFEEVAETVEVIIREVGDRTMAAETLAPRAMSPTVIGSVEQIAVVLGRQVEEGLVPTISAIADRLDELKLGDRLSAIQNDLAALVQQRTIKDYYSTEEVARIVGRDAYTVREWCRYGRLSAQKRQCGRGNSAEWIIPHAELMRYQNEGLLPIQK